MIDTADTSPGQGPGYFSRSRTDRLQFLPTEIQGKEKFSRDEILTAFNSGYQRFETTVKEILKNNNLPEKIADKWKNGEDLTPDEEGRLQSLDNKTKKRLSDFQILTIGKRLTLDQDKDKFKHSFEEYSSKEGVPVEGLLDFLHSEIQEIKTKAQRGELSQDEAKRQISALFKEGHIIYKSSNLASRDLRVKRGADAVEGTRVHARARVEAKYISEDPLRKKYELTGDEKLKAEFLDEIATMQNRRELKIPKEGINGQTETSVVDDEGTIAEGDRPEHEEERVVDEPSVVEEAPVIVEGDQPEKTGELSTTPIQSLANVRRECFVVNRSVDVRKRAAEIAETQLREEMRRGKWYNPKDFFRRVKLRLAEEFYRQKYKERALKAMQENNNSYLDFDCVKDVVRDANRNRIGQKKAGEAMIGQLKTGELIAGQQIKEAQGALKTAIIDEIIKPIIDGRITDEGKIRETLKTFIETHQNDPDVQAVFGRDTNRYKVLADFFASDLLEMGNLVKDDIYNHRYALEYIDEHTSFKLANSSWGAETEANFNFVDKAVAWAQNKPWKGVILNPASVGAITSLAYSAITLVGRSGASGKLNLVAPGLGSLVGGGFAAVRRWHDLNIDIASHRAEMAYGLQTSQGAKRREAIERLNYNTASIKDLLAGGGQEVTTGVNREAIDQLLRADLSVDANRQKVIQRIAEISQRVDLSVNQHIDLITAQGSRDILRQLGGLTEQEGLDIGRMELVKQIARMKITLRQAGMSDNDLNNQLDQVKGNWQRLLLQNKDQQDRATKNYKLKQAAISGVFGGAVGMGAYFGTQEVFALGERALGMQIGETHLEHILDKLGDLAAGRPHIETPTVGMLTDFYNHGGNVDLGNHLQMQVDQATHHVSILDAAGHVRTDIPPVSLDAQGHIDIAGKLPPDIENTFNQMHFTVDIDGGLTILDINAPTHIDLSTGHQTMIPNGTEWVNDHGRWDLVLSADHSKILIDNAGFNPDGTISGYNTVGSLLNDPSKVDFGHLTQTSVDKIIGGAPTHEDLVTGFKTMIPDGSHWVNDGGKWDLVLDSDQSKILVNDVVFDNHGAIAGYDATHSLIKDQSLIDLGKFSHEGGGKAIWDNTADYRVVHAYGETYHPISNETFSTGNNEHPFGVRFNFPQQTIHNPNTGAIESMAEAAKDNRVGLFLQIPHFGQHGEDVGVFVPAHFDSKINEFVVDFNPADHTTMINLSDGSQISMADLSQNFLNEKLLTEYVSQHHGPGILGSETWYEGRQFFNLANPDGVVAHQGRILGGYFDEASKLYGHLPPPGQEQGAFIAIHAVHGSGTVNLSEGFEGFEPPAIDGRLVTEVHQTLQLPKIPPIEIKGPELIPPIEAPPGIPIPWAPRKPLEPVEGFQEEPIITTPYSPYDTGYGNIEDQRKELAQAHSSIENFVRGSPLLLETEKDEAVLKAKNYLNSQESKQIPPMKAFSYFKEMWQFIEVHPDFNELKRNDGSVSTTIQGQITSIINSITTDPDKQAELVQVIGKFLLLHSDYLASTDNEKIIKVLIMAYQTNKSIISPI